MQHFWSEHVRFDEACRRANGRRHYNVQSQLKAEQRRGRVAELLTVYGYGYGAQAAIARRLGVHRSTVCRDVHELLASCWGDQFLECHLAGWSVAEIARGYGVRLPVVRHTLERSLRVSALMMCLVPEDDRPPSDAEIGAQLRLPEPTVRRYINQALREYLDTH